MVDGLGDTGVDTLITLGTDAAGQTAIGFRNRLGFGKTDTDFLETGVALFRFHDRIFFTGNLGHIGNICFVRQIFGPVFLTAGFHINALQIAVDGFGGFLAGKDGFNNGLRTGDYVTAGENTGNVCRVSYFVVINVIPLIDGNAAFLRNKGEVCLLTDRGHEWHRIQR